MTRTANLSMALSDEQAMILDSAKEWLSLLFPVLR